MENYNLKTDIVSSLAPRPPQQPMGALSPPPPHPDDFSSQQDHWQPFPCTWKTSPAQRPSATPSTICSTLGAGGSLGNPSPHTEDVVGLWQHVAFPSQVENLSGSTGVNLPPNWRNLTSWQDFWWVLPPQRPWMCWKEHQWSLPPLGRTRRGPGTTVESWLRCIL